ncbi:MAG: TIGR00730 family Rossman fold protein [Gammaproteobacteria bacterium]|nr:TIGR00730 family Rossman fold protein [Gammaproteobacteria bacterium]
MKKKLLKEDREKRRQPGHLFHDAAEDRFHAQHKGKPPQAEAQINSSAYRLAFDDLDYLLADEQRPLRLLLELDKPETELKKHGIEHTVVIFGSARTQEKNPYYQQANELSALISNKSGCDSCPDLYVVTGGGPGIMEAANRGANEAGYESIGLNIVLPHEQYPNSYISPELCFRFHYFAIRKMHFLLRARAIVAFPGGFGTMDEVFEALTLVQTGKIEPMPILLFGKEYWQRLINFDVFVEEGMASPEDMEHFVFVDDVEEAWDIIRQSMVDEI